MAADIKWLTNLANELQVQNKPYDAVAVLEAVYELERLRAAAAGAEVARLRTDLLREQIDRKTAQMGRETAEAEIDRLTDALACPTPEMIAAAWEAWRSRHGGKLGPGPGFREAIEAAGRALVGTPVSTAPADPT
jgi:hypothetical protein